MTYPPFHPRSPNAPPLFLSVEEFTQSFPAESEYVERKSGFNGTALQEAAVAFCNALVGIDRHLQIASSLRMPSKLARIRGSSQP